MNREDPDITPAQEREAEDRYEARRGYRNPLGEHAEDDGPDGYGWSPDPYPNGGII